MKAYTISVIVPMDIHIMALSLEDALLTCVTLHATAPDGNQVSIVQEYITGGHAEPLFIAIGKARYA